MWRAHADRNSNVKTKANWSSGGNRNFFDLTTLGARYGSSDNVRWREGDFNGDGTVNFPDPATRRGCVRTLPRYAGGGQGGGPASVVKQPLNANVGTLQTRSTNAANEITSVSGSWVTPTYDAAGNMVSAPRAGAETTRLWYVFDAWNRIVIVKNDSSGSPGSTLAEYDYDGLNRRITKVTTGEDAATFDDYFNESWQRLESRKNGDADPLDQFLWDVTYIDTPVLRWHDANTDGDLADVSPDAPGPSYDNTLYYTTDANHNITALYDADQERVIERYVYDPYGKTFVYDRTWGAISSSAVDNDVQYAGYVSDKETGNKLARNRYYGVPLATWYARDFAGYMGGSNLFEYVRGRALSATDPSGLIDVITANPDIREAFQTLEKNGYHNLPRIRAQEQKQNVTVVITIAETRGTSSHVPGGRFDNPPNGLARTLAKYPHAFDPYKGKCIIWTQINPLDAVGVDPDKITRDLRREPRMTFAFGEEPTDWEMGVPLDILLAHELSHAYHLLTLQRYVFP